MSKTPRLKSCNPIARDLRQGKYRKRVVPSAKVYNRKKNPRLVPGQLGRNP